jgi:integrase
MASKKAKERRDPGSGSVYESPKGSGRWFAALRIEETEKPLRRRATSEQAAYAKLAALEELKRKRIDVTKGSQTFADWLNTFHAEKNRLAKPSIRSIEFSKSKIESYIIPKMGKLRLLEIRPTHIQTCIDEVYEEIGSFYADTTGYDGARTARAVALVIKEAVTLAFDRKLILDNPYSGIRLPKYRRKKITPMTDEQCREFFAAVMGKLDKRPGYTDSRGRRKSLPKLNPRLAALWMSYLLLGERRGEGLGTLCQNIDWEQRTVKITQQVQRINGRNADGGTTVSLHIGDPKTEDSERELPLTNILYSLYCQRWDEMQEEWKLKGMTWTGQGLLFTSENNTPLWPDNIEMMFRRIREAAGLPKTIKLHHLRHTLATLCDECGCTEALKADILGHSKKTQSQKYTHGRIAAMRDVLQRVEDRILGGVVLGEMTG